MSICSDDWCEMQFAKYMSPYTTLTLRECYNVYTRPGLGGKKWSPEEKALFEKIKEITGGQENPFFFRFMQ